MLRQQAEQRIDLWEKFHFLSRSAQYTSTTVKWLSFSRNQWLSIVKRKYIKKTFEKVTIYYCSGLEVQSHQKPTVHIWKYMLPDVLVTIIDYFFILFVCEGGDYIMLALA